MNNASSLSENEDDPGVDGDWDDSEEKKRKSRRSSKRLSKKPRVTHAVDLTSESSADEEEVKKQTKNGMNKKQKLASSRARTQKAVYKKVIYSKDFSTGTFVINKKDAQVGDPNIHPCIWRIDGKALLQKYEPLESEGKILHENTSIYTGWSPLDKDQYAPVPVNVHQQTNNKLVVELHWDKLKEITIDSD